MATIDEKLRNLRHSYGTDSVVGSQSKQNHTHKRCMNEELQNTGPTLDGIVMEDRVLDPQDYLVISRTNSFDVVVSRMFSQVPNVV